ncbi:MAG: asparagine synthetase B [Alphaproteobacteria bacterium]|nr:MAG: asparagine synthetase B [Alphaproteobacteria bacterium]
MSGIAGYLGASQPPSILRAMTGKMMHRGPDAQSFHEEAPVFMGVRQLGGAETGAGAYVDSDRNLAIVFSGECSNLHEERDTLEKKGMQLAEGSAAEVVLRLYEVHGVGCVNRLRGAFVFAIHDQQKDLVFIARDHLGVKPLYYATSQSGTFVFASEIKALFEHPNLSVEADLRGVDAFLSLGCSPGPDAMFKGVHQLPPGHHILWNPGLHVMIEPYWRWESFAKPDPVLKSDDDFRARFAMLFEDAVRQQSPDAGVVLTGDVESAAVAAALAKASGGSAPAFCLDLHAECGAPSLAVAEKLGLKAEPVAFGPHDLDKLPEILWALDEPVVDISVAPLYLATRVAQKKVRGVLLGACGAEILASLPAQEQLLDARDKPASWYSIAKSMYSIVPQSTFGKYLGFGGRIGPRTKQRLFGFIEALRSDGPWRQYLSLTSILDAREKHELYIGGMTNVMETFVDMQKDPEGWPTAMSALVAVQRTGGFFDSAVSSAEKTGMFSSVECRLPFLDHRLAEFLIGLPDHLRRTPGRNKVLLRDYLDKTHPGLLQPVAAPAEPRKSLLVECLSASPLKEMVETCLSETSVRRRELFDWKAVKTILAGSKTDEALYARQVFALLMLELWFRIFIDGEKGWLSR